MHINKKTKITEELVSVTLTKEEALDVLTLARCVNVIVGIPRAQGGNPPEGSNRDLQIIARKVMAELWKFTDEVIKVNGFIPKTAMFFHTTMPGLNKMLKISRKNNLPYGYYLDKDKKMCIYPEVSTLINYIYELFIIYENAEVVADVLTVEGGRHSFGQSEFTEGKVKWIIANTQYFGASKYPAMVSEDKAEKARKILKRQTVLNKFLGGRVDLEEKE